MKHAFTSVLFIVLIITISILSGCRQRATTQARKDIKRVGMVIGIKPEMIEEYKRLHADSASRFGGLDGDGAGVLW